MSSGMLHGMNQNKLFDVNSSGYLSLNHEDDFISGETVHEHDFVLFTLRA